ncbi:hypothetical protein ONS96_012198 [Cadophora gregata f. sp. sojae]|nr:hypothetical protein ONS96_012198 [Cadophora gregata f. sp. sojae]
MNRQSPSTTGPQASKEKRDEKKRKSKYKLKADSLSKAKKATAGTPIEPSRNVPGKPLVDFFVFANLPAEIQDEIWEVVCFQDPATISIIVEPATVKMVGPLPNFPSLLHATSGARGIGLRYFEVLTSFDVFHRESLHTGLNLQAAALNPALVQAGPGQGNIHGFALPPATLNPTFPWLVPHAAIHGTHVGLHGQMNQAAQMMGQFGPGHVLGTAGNNTTTNNGPFTYYPAAPALPGFGPAPGGVNDTGGTSIPDKNTVILIGAFPVISGNVVGLCNEPTATHPFMPVESQRSVLPGKPGCCNFYSNLSADKFKLQIGDVVQYNYPTFSLAEESSVTCVKNFILTEKQRQEEISAMLSKYAVLPAFPGSGKLPPIFKEVENLVLNISLPPCVNLNEYSEWATKNARSFLSSLYVRSTVRRFPNLRTLDFYVPGDHKINPFSKMALKHWRDVVVRDSDGMTLSRSQMGLLEMIMAVEMAAIRKEVGNDEIPASRLLVYVPQKAGRMEFDADFVD